MAVGSIAPVVELTPGFPVRKFTLTEFYRLLETDVFPPEEHFEFIDGWIIPKMNRNPPHEFGVGAVTRELWPLVPARWHLRSQASVRVEECVFEPDVSVVRGVLEDYEDRHPGPEDVALIVEVSDTTLSSDREVKGPRYAAARIPWYWIVNLPERRIEVYSNPTGPAKRPRYRKLEVFEAADSLPVMIAGKLVGHIEVSALLTKGKRKRS